MANLTEAPALVVFTDLTRFAEQCEHHEDARTAEMLDGYYELVGTAVQAAGGHVVKFIGDAAMLVFPPDAADAGVEALLELNEHVERFLADRGWESRFLARVHFGSVVTGLFGARGDKRYDVFGKTVNTTARLPSTGIALSAEAFRKLGPELRQRFKKHTPPITYIRNEDPRPRMKQRPRN